MSVNSVILIGNITRDAEVRQVGQNQVAKFGLATSEKYKNTSGEFVEETEFHNVELWGSVGVHPYLKKGQLVFVQGSIKTDRWTDQQGVDRSVVKVKAKAIQLLGPRPQQAQPQATQAPQRPAPIQQRPSRPVPPAPQASPIQTPPPPTADDYFAPATDDLPF